MVNQLHSLADALHHARRVAGRMILVALMGLVATVWANAQEPALHFQHPVGMPPGAIGGQQLLRGGPLPGFFQPVEIKAPSGALVSLAEGGRFSEPQKSPVPVGLLIGQVYRICVLNIPQNVGAEIFPTIEVVDRLYAPLGQETRFPIQIELSEDDLQLALAGKFVTRVIYLEDPKRALPADLAGHPQSWFDVAPGHDPLVVADGLGRPVAILRMGGRVPTPEGRMDAQFLYGSPPLVHFAPRPALPSGPAKKRTPAPKAPAAPAKPVEATDEPVESVSYTTSGVRPR
jgi:hypothetical protein